MCAISSVQDAAEGITISSDVPRMTRHCFQGSKTLGFLQNTSFARPSERPCAGAGGGARHYYDPLSGCADDNEHAGSARNGEFIHRSAQTWNLTLVFLSSLMLVFIEIYCAFSLVKGRNWARWVYLLTQITAAGYLWAASLGYGYPGCSAYPVSRDVRFSIHW